MGSTMGWAKGNGGLVFVVWAGGEVSVTSIVSTMVCVCSEGMMSVALIALIFFPFLFHRIFTRRETAGRTRYGYSIGRSTATKKIGVDLFICRGGLAYAINVVADAIAPTTMANRMVI